jgi:hypothetical protein
MQAHTGFGRLTPTIIWFVGGAGAVAAARSAILAASAPDA